MVRRRCGVLQDGTKVNVQQRLVQKGGSAYTDKVQLFVTSLAISGQQALLESLSIYCILYI